MKKIFFMMAGVSIFSMILFACTTTAKAPVVAKNADLSADFKSIKSYSWTQGIDNIPKEAMFIGPNGVYIFNNESGRKMIKDAIQYELDSRGYVMNKNNPDMFISFSAIEQPASLRTTDGYVTLSSGAKVRTEDNVSYTDVKPGTLLINFINAKNNKQIWQGFASGILQADQMKDESKVRQAVSSIFAEFKYNNKM